MPPTTRGQTAAAAQGRKRLVEMAAATDETHENSTDNKTKTKRAKTKKDVAVKKQKRSQPAATTITSSSAQPWYYMFTKGDAEYDAYMSTEWGFEKRGDMPLFEKLSLEGAQSGLSWRTILRKRDAYRRVFYNFDPIRVAAMTNADVERILGSGGDDDPRDIIVRHSGKIQSVINNAKCLLKMREEYLSSSDKKKKNIDHVFDQFLWSFVQDKPIINRTNLSDFATTSPESEAMSKALKKRGFRFVGPTTCYAFMQSVGMVIDHPMDSPEWQAAYERLKSRPGGYQERNI